MYNRRYDKVFLMLRQETAGYSMGQRAPWGSCVMEIKNGVGRISLTVQGLRPVRRGRYAVYAIAGEGKSQNNFFCGILTPDVAGHGKLKWDFNPDDVEGRKQTAEQLNTVAILAETDGGFSVPLTAYFGSKVEWRTYFKSSSKKVETKKEFFKKEVSKKEDVKKEAENTAATLVAAEASVADMPSFELPKINWKKDVEKPKEAMEKPAEASTKPQEAAAKPAEASAKPAEAKQESYHGSFRGLLEKFRQELEELQDAGVFNNKDMERIERAGRRNLKNEVVAEAINLNSVEEATEEVGKEAVKDVMETVTAEVLEDTMEAATAEVVEDVMETTVVEMPEAATPKEMVQEEENEAEPTVESLPKKYVLLTQNEDMFPFGEEDEPWKCISLEETVLLEDMKLSWLKEYFFLIPMKKYHHYIWKPDAQGYALGVPGTDTVEERRKAEELGFKEFKKMENGEVGYWILRKK